MPGRKPEIRWIRRAPTGPFGRSKTHPGKTSGDAPKPRSELLDTPPPDPAELPVATGPFIDARRASEEATDILPGEGLTQPVGRAGDGPASALAKEPTAIRISNAFQVATDDPDVTPVGAPGRAAEPSKLPSRETPRRIVPPMIFGPPPRPPSAPTRRPQLDATDWQRSRGLPQVWDRTEATERERLGDRFAEFDDTVPYTAFEPLDASDEAVLDPSPNEGREP